MLHQNLRVQVLVSVLPVLYLSTWIRGKEELANQISVHHGEKTDSILQNDQLIQEAFNHASETSIKVVDL